jgi:hypothetical protein
MLKKLQLFTLACLAALPSAAQAEAPRAAEDRPWSTRLLKNDRILLSGVHLETGDRFELQVSRDGLVRGTLGRREVRYYVSPQHYAQLRQRHGRPDTMLTGTDSGTSEGRPAPASHSAVNSL